MNDAEIFRNHRAIVVEGKALFSLSPRRMSGESPGFGRLQNLPFSRKAIPHIPKVYRYKGFSWTYGLKIAIQKFILYV